MRTRLEVEIRLALFELELENLTKTYGVTHSLTQWFASAVDELRWVLGVKAE